MVQIVKTKYRLIKMSRVFSKLNVLLLVHVLHLYLHCFCLAEDSIEEVGLDFEVLNGDAFSTIKDHDSFVVCNIYLPGARERNPGKFDATDSKYNFDGNLCTHLVLNYFELSSKFFIIEDDDFDEIEKFRPIKMKYPHLRLLLGIRIDGTNKNTLLNELVFSRESRQTFITQMKTTLRRFDLDGFLFGGGIYHDAPKRFTNLAYELRDEFKKEGLLFAAEIDLWRRDLLQEYANIAEISRLFDLIFVNTDGFNYKEGNIPLARYYSPLYSKEINDDNIYDNLLDLLTHWQISTSSLVLTIFTRWQVLRLQNGTNTDSFPFGYNSETDSHFIDSPWRGYNRWSYDEVCSTVLYEEDWKMYWDDTAKVPFLKNDRRWISFENSKSTAEKTKLANELGLRGISIFTINYDDVSGLCSNTTYPFLKTVNYELSKTQSQRGSKFCSLFNDDKNSSLNEKYEPILLLSTHLLKVAKDDSVEINCTAEGSPPFELNWSKRTRNKSIVITSDDNNVEILTVKQQGYCTIEIWISTLKLQKVHSTDIYSCHVSFSNRTKTTEVTLEIQGVEAYEASPSASSPSVTIWITVLALSFVLICGIAIGSVIITVLRRMKNNGITKLEIARFRKGMITHGDVQDPENSPYDESWELTNNEYYIDKTTILGSGQFGIVYSGQIKGVDVAVKTTKPGADKKYLKSLLSELKILIYIECHPHIVNLKGAVTSELTKGFLYVFVELCPLGNLQDYLRKFKEEFIICGEERTVGDSNTLVDLLKWSFQIASGLSHLSSKNVIHGDLAARNVLLYDTATIKITDFGLSRKLYEYTTYFKKTQEPLPWRWMAIESLREMKFSIQSDVWSFGVTIWEIFSLGEIPYPGLSWSCNFVDKLEENMRLQKPKYSPDSLYNILLECWKSNPMERPSPEKNLASFSKLMREHFQDMYFENE